MPAVTDAPFRPRRGRLVPAVIGAVTLLGAVVLAVALPERFQLVDRVMITGMGAAVAGLMARYATIRATPRPEGLWVRNLGPGRLVPWAEIESVRHAEGMPWPRLDLLDGDEVAVMAVQRADGELGRRELQRLADLVAARQHPA